jgi:hypothetical protein
MVNLRKQQMQSADEYAELQSGSQINEQPKYKSIQNSSRQINKKDFLVKSEVKTNNNLSKL